jgi:hypothetical protein
LCISDEEEFAMQRRLMTIFAALTLVGMACFQFSSGSFSSISASPTTAHAESIVHSRWANHISGFALQALETGIQGSLPPAKNPIRSSGAPLPTLMTYGCSQVDGNNVRVNQDCTNDTLPSYWGRGQAQDETAIAVNPLNSKNLIAGQNDYRRGDGTCGADFSLDGGQHWGNTLIPVSFTVPGVDNPSTQRHYWTSSGDPSVAFDSHGVAYYACMAFDRASPINDDGCTTNSVGFCASGIFVFRSVDGGASWDVPDGTTAPLGNGQGQVIATPTLPSTTGQFNLEDKPYMAVDSNPKSPYHDNIYVSWTHFAPCPAPAPNTCETADIYFAYSRDGGQTFSTPMDISGSSPTLCPNSVNPNTPDACDANDFSNPFVGPDGSVYVAFRNFNNAVTPPDNYNDILLVKSTTGGATFSGPVLVTHFYDLPDCYTYTSDDFGRSCVPTAPLSDVSVFRATNYPSGVANPTNAKDLYVTFGSYINPDSKETNPAGHGQCSPNGFNPNTGANLYTGVGTPNDCNNDILLSYSTDGGTTWSGQTIDPRNAPVISNETPGTLTDQFWQWAAINSSGDLVVSYYDRKYGNDQANGSLDITIAASPGTLSFAHERVTSRSTPSPTEFPDNTNGYGLFNGDYSGLAVSGTTAWPFWTDSRNAEYFQCPSPANPLMLCRNMNGTVPGFDEDVFTTAGLQLAGLLK